MIEYFINYECGSKPVNEMIELVSGMPEPQIEEESS
jgi:hypothetical protein